MVKSNELASINVVKRWFILGVPTIFIIGSLMHFLYEWSGNSAVVGIFAPVNESVWEHLKMVFWPLFLWWLIGYLLISRNNRLEVSRWIVAASIGLFIAPLMIVIFFYTYTSTFGIDLLLLDIFSMLLSLVIGQCLAFHFYKYIQTKPSIVFLAVSLLIISTLAFLTFTFNAPHIPMFLDSLTGGYGI